MKASFRIDENTMKVSVILIALLLVSVASVLAQTSPVRPKIGVTLSGGGAKGFAHIGILQAIDSAGLKVDYITGTSMGSVVGGLYASGYSGNSIETLARALDWNRLFSTAPQLNAISIEEKDEFNKYALEVPFEGAKFKIGTGIIEGQELWLKFAELFYPVYNIRDFSQLSIPFKCIGTDLSTGEAVVMGDGNIITAIRASMAIPAVFTPVQYQGKTLVDGGIVNNFPVMDVKEMGADFVIGVNLNKGLDKAEDLKTSFDVLLQLAFFKDASTFEQHKEACDIYILPDLEGHGTGSFAASDSIIDIGKKYGRLYYPVFKKLADSLNSIYPDTHFVKDRLPKTKVVKIRSYSVDGLKNTTPKFFFGQLGLQENTEFSNEKLAESIRTAYGSRYYKKIQYDFITNDSGQTDLRFKVEENALTAVKFGLNYNTATKLSLIFNITSRDLLFKESRALASVAISENPRLNLEYFKYLGKHRKFGFNGTFFKEYMDYPIYSDFDLYETVRSSYSYFDLRLQYSINQNSYVGFSHQFNNSRLRTVESPDITLKTKDRYYHSYLSYQYNNVDKKYFSTRGWKIKFEAGIVYGQRMDYSTVENGEETPLDTALFDTQNYGRFLVKADRYSTIHPKFVFFQNLTVGYLTSDEPYITNAYQLGGVGENFINQVPFYGLNDTELKTGSVASGQLGLQYKLGKSIYLTGRVNIALYDFHNESFSNLSTSKNFLSGYGLTFGFDSAIGPVEITSMYCDQDGSFRTNVNLGFRFLKQ
jgi:NTE family protein